MQQLNVPCRLPCATKNKLTTLLNRLAPMPEAVIMPRLSWLSVVGASRIAAEYICMRLRCPGLLHAQLRDAASIRIAEKGDMNQAPHFVIVVRGLPSLSICEEAPDQLLNKIEG